MEACRSYGGKMVESWNVANSKTTLKKVKKHNQTAIVLGATDEEEEGQWVWASDENKELFAHENDNSFQPRFNRESNCVVMTTDGKLMDGPCSTELVFCEALMVEGETAYFSDLSQLGLY